MRNFLLVTSAVLVIAEPAAAKDGSFYTGLELGLTFPKKPTSEVFVDYTTTNDTFPDEGGTLPPSIPAGPGDFTSVNPIAFKVKRGWDSDIIGGYDFGLVRLQCEIG